ncbi:MAG: MATE family efflux transporter [Hyphomicrobium sp.]
MESGSAVGTTSGIEAGVVRNSRMSRPPAKFVTGSILRHILVMTGTGALGLVAIFLGDLANILFLSWLGDEAIVAAVGYASSILFFTISVGIGLSIAATSLVSPAIGSGRRVRARRLSVGAHLVTAAIAALFALLVFLLLPQLLALLGASGRTAALAEGYLRILVPSLPMLALAMTSAAVLRSVGDARRAMNVTLSIAVVNTLLDPLLIFGLGLGIDGAAIASTLARSVSMLVGLYGVVRVHNLMGRPRWRPLIRDARALGAVAVPAILTNIASPVSNAYVTMAIAPHGDSAVAGWAIIGRIIPVAFGAVYALSGSIGPILGQNWGAGAFDRLRATFTQALAVTAAFTLVAWAALALLAWPLADLFRVEGEAARLIVFFCRWLAPLFLFLGILFVANAAFNTLGAPHTSTALNWGRATIGTIPFVEAGSALAGAEGVIAGNMLGGIAFGLAGVWLCYRLIDRLSNQPPGVAVRSP